MISIIPSLCARPVEARRRGSGLAGFGRGAKALLFASVAVVACSMLQVSNAAAQAANTLDAAKKRGHLIIGTGGAKQGFSFKSEAGELQGIDIEIGRQLALGLFGDETKVEFVTVGSAERVPSLSSGRIDAIISTLSTFIQRAAVIELSLPYCNSDYAALVRADSPYKRNSDLNGKPIAARAAAELEKLIKRAMPDAQIQGYRDDSAGFTAFRQGRTEAYLDDHSAEAFLMMRFPGEYRVINDYDNPLERSQYAIGVKQGDQVFLNFVNHSLNWMRNSGKLAEIHKKWLGTDELIPAWARGPY